MSRQHEEIIAGLHAVQSALSHDPASVLELWVDAGRRDNRLNELVQLAGTHGIAVHRVDSRSLDRRSEGVRHQGVVARCRSAAPLAEADLDELLARREGTPLLLVLDGVTDPHNLGACLRTADAAGVWAVITPRDRAAGLTPVARKVASGAAERVPLIQVTNLARTLKQLQSQGIWIIGTGDAADASLYETDLAGPLALVMGAEGKGMRRLTAEQCDQLVAIPMQGSVSSLNVSVATGVCLFEAVRQRG
jgi:23S rRNA (guanosine2251-2'-O)-methyltransferase